MACSGNNGWCLFVAVDQAPHGLFELPQGVFACQKAVLSQFFFKVFAQGRGTPFPEHYERAFQSMEPLQQVVFILLPPGTQDGAQVGFATMDEDIADFRRSSK